MNILGLNAYGHDSAASILKDGNLVFAVEEERLNRKKHSGAFPIESIHEALKFSNLDISEIDHITFPWNPYIAIRNAPIYLLKYWKTLPILLKEKKDFSMEEQLGMINHFGDIKKIPKVIKELFPGKKLKFKFHTLEHHMCHAASAFYPSGFDEAAILTYDGAGEWATTLLGHGKGKKIKKMHTIDTPHSIGAPYQAISRFLGFSYGAGPGKLMGLASYGKRDSEEYRKLKKLIYYTGNGRYKINMDFFSYHYSRRRRGVSEKFIELFGSPCKDGTVDWTQSQLNLAAAMQQVTEELIFELVKFLKEKTQSKNLCLAGGVALNSVTNGLIAKAEIFENIFIQPAAGDSGTSLGSALLLNHNVLNNEINFTQKDTFLGPEYLDKEIEKEFVNSNLKYSIKSFDEIYDRTCELLLKDKIIGWHQGRMEFGPRSLGNRSFLASPFNKEMKDILNKRVKFREPFRPFAAIVLEEDTDKYFDCSKPNPYMLLVYNVKKEFQKILPAITHADETVRIQTVNKNENLHMYNLLKKFKEKSGHSVLINTSFNIKGEPIVCKPKDSINSFQRADIDALVIDKFISER